VSISRLNKISTKGENHRAENTICKKKGDEGGGGLEESCHAEKERDENHT